MTNLDILRANFQPFPAVKTSQWNLLSKCLVQMSHKNVSLNCLFKCLIKCLIKMSSKCLIKMSSKCLIKISHQNVSSKFLMKMSHQTFSSKCFIKMPYQNVTGPANFLSAQSHTELRVTDLHNSDYLKIHYMIFRWAIYKNLLQYT